MRFLAPDYKKSKLFAHIGGQPLGLAFDREREPLRLRRRHGPLSGRARRQRVKGDRRDQPLDASRSSTIPACGSPTISTSRPTAAIFFTRSHHPLRHAPLAGRFAGEPRQRPHHLLRPEHQFDPHRASPSEVSQRRLHRAMTASRCSSPKPGAAASTATGSTDRRPARVESVIAATAGLSGQYQSRLRRQLLAGDRRHALAGARSRAAMPGFRRRMARRVAQDEWLYPNLNTGCVVKFNDKGEIARGAVGPQGATIIR